MTWPMTIMGAKKTIHMAGKRDFTSIKGKISMNQPAGVSSGYCLFVVVRRLSCLWSCLWSLSRLCRFPWTVPSVWINYSDSLTLHKVNSLLTIIYSDLAMWGRYHVFGSVVIIHGCSPDFSIGPVATSREIAVLSPQKKPWRWPAKLWA